ncbi:beta-glucosidase [Lentzea sp. NBRC 105346]|uniref:glycoside hydrolase family 3 C-terminal domain-containing protein n=1 Tax=Lentzea sp. NBRC 105346 TaxID=3032205 RepID=UPI0024A0D65D|nr:glycoside hydrolase family 3 C-terminal domain-containing protein [Lentzea sp. NBRC 105346]GLZ31011.1 beta-glucosidase [Lentzea sp. NBRC 105346]
MLRTAVVLVLAASTLTAPAHADARADCPWVGSSAPIEERVRDVLGAMTIDEKLSVVHGANGASPFAGVIPAIPRVCVPSFLLHDGPNGVGGLLSGVTQLPAPVGAAATWNTGLVRQYGEVEGAEHKTKGTSVALAPMVNIIRDPRAGRNFETYSEDPYLTSRMGVANIQGMQSKGVLAQVKHLAAYNQETDRFSPSDNSVVSERTLQEIYLPQFEAAIREGGASSVMCSYNWVNGVNACENRYLLTEVLRDQWKFDGFVTSDWGGTKSTVPAANNGLDMEMPTGDHFGTALKTALRNGQVSGARLDAMAGNVLRPLFRFGLFENPIVRNPGAPAARPEHATIARKIADESAVLLKNDGKLLPLNAPRSIAVIGEGAEANVKTTGGLGNPVATPPGVVSPLRAIQDRAGSDVRVTYSPGTASALPAVPANRFSGLTGKFFAGKDLSGPELLTRPERTVDFNWGTGKPANEVPADNWSASFGGRLTPPESGTFTFSLTSDDGSRLYVNGKRVIDNWRDQGAHTEVASVDLTKGEPVDIRVEFYENGGDASVRLGWGLPGSSPVQEAVRLAREAEVAVVFADVISAEGSDLSNMDLPRGQNELISAVAEANPNTVVVLQSGSPVSMPWIGSVKSVLEGWFPGQSIGPVFAGLLYGDTVPSGKLPVTFPRSLADAPTAAKSRFPGENGEVRYDEELGVGYRWYDQENIEPLFPFGHGLSYTTFQVDRLTVSRTGPPVSVSATVTNTGDRAGSEVVQVYVGFPSAAGEPPRQLKAFTKVRLEPGQSKRVTMRLDARAFSMWDSGWKVVPGAHEISVGTSSRNLPLRSSVTIRG